MAQDQQINLFGSLPTFNNYNTIDNSSQKNLSKSASEAYIRKPDIKTKINEIKTTLNADIVYAASSSSELPLQLSKQSE